MKHFMLIIFILICLLPSVLSESSIAIRQGYMSTIQGGTTIVSGIITENTTWTFEGSPYIVAGDLAVDLDVFLTIEPGVTVKFTNDTNLIIDGRITAHGNTTHKIIFTSNSTTPSRGDWGGINIREYSSHTSLKHIQIEYASTALNAKVDCNITDSFFQHNDGNVILLESPGNIYIRNVQVINNTGTGINVDGQNITIENTETSENGGGIITSGDSTYIRNITVTENTGTGLRIRVKSATAEVYDVNVSANGGGIVGEFIQPWEGRLDIYNSSITHNRGTGLSQGGFGSYITARDSIFLNNSNGIRPCSRSRSIVLEGCDIIGHRKNGVIVDGEWNGISLNDCRILDNALEGIYVSGEFCGATVHNSVISNNTNGISLIGEVGMLSASVHNSTINRNHECGVLLGGGCSGEVELHNSVVENNPNGIISQVGTYLEGRLNSYGSKIINNTIGVSINTVSAFDSRIINNSIGVSADTVTASSTVIANNSLANIQPIEEGITCSMKYCDIYDSPLGLKVKSGTINFCNLHSHSDYYLENTAGNDINAIYNWWGTTNETLIEEHIYDYYDNHSLGRVFYKPYLEASVESYPVASFIYEPVEPVVDEAILFDASASYDMDGTITWYIWDFGDGTNATESEPTVAHAYNHTGNYTVTLTVIDNEGLNHTTIDYVDVGKMNSSISISVSPALIMIGYYTRISGSITPKREGVNVTVWYRLWGEEFWSLLRNVTTNQDSKYSFDWTPLEARTFELKANWTGDEYTLPAETSLVHVFCLKIATHISISTSCPSTYIGFKVNITGTLQDTFDNVLKNETVVLYYTFSGAGSWTPITSDTTNDNGEYSALWLPPATGYFILKAEWAGNSTHRYANNTTTLSSLPYQDQFIFTVESNSTISELAFNTTDWTLSFDTAGPNGTKGYIKITVAKNLVSDITNMRLYIDGIQNTNFSVISMEDSWLLTFNYNHSTHQVLVDLDLNIIPEFPLLFPILFVIAALLLVLAKAKKDGAA